MRSPLFFTSAFDALALISSLAFGGLVGYFLAAAAAAAAAAQALNHERDRISQRVSVYVCHFWSPEDTWLIKAPNIGA